MSCLGGFRAITKEGKGMRRAREDELGRIAGFLIDQFFEKEELQQMFRGIDEAKARETAREAVYQELRFFFRHGDVFVYDDGIAGAAAGIESRRMSLLRRLPFALQGSRALSGLSRSERKLLNANSRVIKEVHSGSWFRKYCRSPYCFTQFAVGREMRGKGLAREMLEGLFAHVREQNGCMVLETLTESNVPIYEHFGFELMESHETRGGELTEYRMLKRLDR